MTSVLFDIRNLATARPLANDEDKTTDRVFQPDISLLSTSQEADCNKAPNPKDCHRCKHCMLFKIKLLRVRVVTVL